jgi:hypothetical protein
VKTTDQTAVPTGPACGVAAAGAVEASPEELRALRKRPPLVEEGPPLAALLRHADEHTTAAVAAVGRAIDAGDLGATAFTDWGVVAAPRFPGRLQAAAAVAKFRRQGALSVTPLIVPYMSLNSPANVLSLALRMHGPSLGVGGGPDHVAEGLRAGLALVEVGAAPGAWVVFSEFDPEPPLDADGRPTAPYVRRAVALALTPAAAESGRLLFRPGPPVADAPPRLADLAAFVFRGGDADCWMFPLAEGGAVEWERPASDGRAAA